MIPNTHDTVLWDEINRALMISLGNNRIVENFENSFASYVGSQYAVTFSQGRIGLLALLNFYKRKTGKREVVVPAYTCIVVPNVIMQAGLKPLFVDIEFETYGPDSTEMIGKISSDTLAVIPTHMFGQVCDIEPIVESANDRKIATIEDSALALGAERNEVKAGMFGEASLFSLGITKNINTYDGGVVTTDNKELFDFLKSFQASLGQKSLLSQLIKVSILKFSYAIATNEGSARAVSTAFSKWEALRKLVFNGNTDEIEEYEPGSLGKYKSALGSLQLSKLDQLNNRRREIADAYKSKMERKSWLILPREKSGNFHVYTKYPVLLRPHINADLFLEYLISRGVKGTRLFPYCCPLTPALERLCKSGLTFPNSSVAATNVITLPNYPFMSDQKASYVGEVVSSFQPAKETWQK